MYAALYLILDRKIFHANLSSIVRPRRKVHPAGLFVKREVSDSHDARAFKQSWGHPKHLPVVVYEHVGFVAHLVVAVRAEKKMKLHFA